MLAETVFKMGIFTTFDLMLEKKGHLYLDSQAIQNLEIFDVNYLLGNSKTDSLYGYMNKTVTPFGQRMFRNWILSPPIDPEVINNRLDAIDSLMKKRDFMDLCREKLAKLPDLERYINRIYNLSDEKRLSAIHQEDFAVNRLKDSLKVLEDMKKAEHVIDSFKDYIPELKSKRIRELCTFKEVNNQQFNKKSSKSIKKGDVEGLFPRISHIIEDLQNKVEI